MIKNFLLVFMGGGLGSILRYAVSLFFQSNATQFPWATFCVNIIGSFLIGLSLAYFGKANMTSENLSLLFIAGFCGGFTTFSAFSKESFLLLQNAQWMILSLYLFLTLAIGIASTAFGYWIINRV